MDDRLGAFAARFADVVAADASPAVRAAFAAVPRHRFLPHLRPEQAYVDDALPTRFDAVTGQATSSSTQPSLMARMLDGLALRPGLRVLEIGVGTGYNAALVYTLTGADVRSVDVQPDVVAEARAALAAFSGVRVELADGYLGLPGDGPYDRIIVTCGVRGVPPGWLDQLTDDGYALVPLAHGGLHPIVRVDRGLRVDVVLERAGFMHAAGRLYPALPDDPPPPVTPPRDGSRAPAPVPALDAGYHDLWFAAAAMDRRVTRAIDGQGWLAALVDGDSGALFQPGALYGWGTPSTVDEAARLVEGWVSRGRPPARAWSSALTLAAAAPAPLLVPGGWESGG